METEQYITEQQNKDGFFLGSMIAGFIDGIKGIVPTSVFDTIAKKIKGNIKIN